MASHHDRDRIRESLLRTGAVRTTARELKLPRASVAHHAKMMRREGTWPERVVQAVVTPVRAVGAMLGGVAREPQYVPAPRLPDPAPEAGGPGIPEEEWKPLTPFQIDTSGWHFVLGDVHLPMHDRVTVEAAVREAREKGASVVLLNGDILDMFSISPFYRPPTDDRFVDEIEKGKQFVAWIRSQFPNARIVYREGNHEFRLKRFIAEKAPELFDLPCLSLASLLEFDRYGVEWVADKRKVMLGKLITLHGHEFRKGEGVNPARLAFLRSTASVLIGHHHRTSEHHQRALDERHHAVWSVGCACFTSPDYDPYNQWNFGYAMVEVASDGWFSVHNRRVLNGRVV